MSEYGEYGALNVQLIGERMEQLYCFRYLGVDVRSDGGIETEWKHRPVRVERLQGLYRIDGGSKR